MNFDFIEPILTAKEVADAHRYSVDEYGLIDDFILGAQALLYNAGAFRLNNPMTKVAVQLIVGHWLENRDGMNYDYKNVNKLPYTLQAIVYSLQYVPDEVDANE